MFRINWRKNLKPWEELISLNNFTSPTFDTLPPVREFFTDEATLDSAASEILSHIENIDLKEAISRDENPLPLTQDRESYYGNNHFLYWASGLRERKILLDCCSRNDVFPETCLDFGCASGRVIRHFAVNDPQITIYACDINRAHVEWVSRYLPPTILVFQNHSIPVLPIPDNTLDLISAFSVFTHIETFETTWLMELRRILKPGGLAWITIQSDRTWLEMEPDWPIYEFLSRYADFNPDMLGSAMKQDRRVFRLKADSSYSSQVFYRLNYINDTWGRLFDLVETHHRFPGFQDVVVLQKPS